MVDWRVLSELEPWLRALPRDGPVSDPARLPGSSWAVTAYFNPLGYAARRENFARFHQRLVQRQGVRLKVAELAVGEARHELEALVPPEDHIRLRTPTLLWHKEALLNTAIRALPPDCDKVIWLDADILFEDDAWPGEVAAALERHRLVQPWSLRVQLPRGAAAIPGGGHDPVAFGVGEGEALLGLGQAHSLFGAPCFLSTRWDRYGHPGHAWAARRELFERSPLYDRMIVGGGDGLMAFSSLGLAEPFIGMRNAEQHAPLRSWADDWQRSVGRSVGFVPGRIFHVYHGAFEHRGLATREEVLARHRFDPLCDLELGPDGLLRWANGDSPRIRELSRAVAAYFASRREDG